MVPQFWVCLDYSEVAIQPTMSERDGGGGGGGGGGRGGGGGGGGGGRGGERGGGGRGGGGEEGEEEEEERRGKRRRKREQGQGSKEKENKLMKAGWRLLKQRNRVESVTNLWGNDQGLPHHWVCWLLLAECCESLHEDGVHPLLQVVSGQLATVERLCLTCRKREDRASDGTTGKLATMCNEVLQVSLCLSKESQDGRHWVCD